MTLLALYVLGVGLLPPDRPAVHADDEGFLRGRAVFETLRVYRARPFRLEAHLQRLEGSAAALGLPSPDRYAFAEAVRDAIAAGAEPDAVLRLLWTPGREGVESPTGLVLVSRLPSGLEQARKRGLRLAVLPYAPGQRLAGSKSTSYAENLAAYDEARYRGCDDALLVAPDGTVLEAPTANVWWREGARLLTPSLAQPILPGVTRATLLELAGPLGYEVEEGVYPLARLARADEAFLTSSVREVMPVVELDGLPVGDGRPGPAAAALQRALRACAEAE